MIAKHLAGHLAGAHWARHSLRRKIYDWLILSAAAAGRYLSGTPVLNCAKAVKVPWGDLDDCRVRPATCLCVRRLGNRSREAGTALHGRAGPVGRTGL